MQCTSMDMRDHMMKSNLTSQPGALSACMQHIGIIKACVMGSIGGLPDV